MTSPSEKEQCLFCSMSESMSEEVYWVQCEKCQRWAHFSCAGVDQEVENCDWCCPQCVPKGDQQLKVPGTRSKKRSNKSGHKSDGGSELGGSSDVDPAVKQLEEEQLAKEKAFAKQMAARKKLLDRQKAWKQEQLKQEREMRELELQVQRELEEQQLEHEQQMLDAQLAAEREFNEKREAIRQQFQSSVQRMSEQKNQDAVGRVSEENQKKKVEKWLSGQVANKLMAQDPRGARLKGENSRQTKENQTEVTKPKPMKKGPRVTDTESESEWSEATEENGRHGGGTIGSVSRRLDQNQRNQPAMCNDGVGDGSGQCAGRIPGRQAVCGSVVSDGSGRSIARITREQLAARKAVSQHLPKFGGEAEVWPLFISSFEYTTEACGFSNLENLKRLQDCLRGDALEAVRSRLVLPGSVPDVIRYL